MKKSFLGKILAIFFVFSLLVPVTISIQSCGKPRYNKPRNGGKKIKSSGHVGNPRSKNRHVWGK
ncbi:MAG: hypothetical protein COX70_02480 [Flavobacteriales bacterium CG_4_10_14_0_2_um_filter_32_8]|nr:MAG: hypothetical protein COX70_02480 [Flavobacteriales bacterium CG_4_10_14_0_2_um_filter_32_8]PJB14109.1 MAG: hypothetical protein CO118_10350 [Flavobacteriales bacterium CG_4_9_14_3_um_filter_32_8]